MNDPRDTLWSGEEGSAREASGEGSVGAGGQGADPGEREGVLLASSAEGGSLMPVVVSERVAVSVDRDLFGRTPKRHPDWSHRRGEPRVFALGWSLYLMSATMLSFMSAGVGGFISADTYRPAARVLLLLLAIGVVVLWPMTRLSQSRPREGNVSSVLKDLVVVLVPMQALLWPQVLLTRWPLEVVSVLALSMCAWGFLTGAVLAAALGRVGRRVALPSGVGASEDAGPGSGVRALWMGVWLCVCILGAAASLAVPGLAGATETVESAVRMGSPFSMVFEVTKDRPWTGVPAAVGEVHWLSVGVVGFLAVAGWLAVWLAGRGVGRENGLD